MEVMIKNQLISATINSLGAELVELNKNDKKYIWEVDTNFWDKTSPVLFPTIGLLKNEEYRFNGKTYKLPRHGFARNFDFEVISKNEDSVVFSLKSSEKTLNIYPFQFELRISYLLEGNKLIVTYDVINLSEEKMYYSIGAHPAFAIDGNFEDFTLIFDEDKDLETHKLENELFSGRTETVQLHDKGLPLNYQLFEKDALVFKNSATQSLTIAKGKNPILKVEFSDFPYLGIWTKVNAPFICIEPWLGIADNVNSTGDLTEKEGIQMLESFGENSVSWSVEVF